MTNDPVLESDLHAYVDDQLDVARRIEVEAYLSQRPQAAAQVMADLRIRDELRLALAERRSPAEPKTREAAGRLQRSLAWRRVYGTLQRVAAVLVFIAAGWAGHAYFGPFGAKEVVASVQPPAFVDEAICAHKTSLLREKMPSQPEVSGYDPDDIRSATAIVLPPLPQAWRVVDMQIFPSAYGPSVELAVQPRAGERLSLFALRPGSFAVQQPLPIHKNEVQAAYWQIGDVAYALVADKASADELTETARRLARSLH
ncbi:anti-sigma factor family protein [Sinorhizobium meliloti]|uniref:anti-sigma factor family protein n=1 Tax=Rhizobium meliloti TaxID=382 RepID=UPI000FDB3D21|nr:anti-sigma factor [Sinorhizobium meliloti]RVH29284.1 anti-sigma factor [Sinorhizobium meliloti]